MKNEVCLENWIHAGSNSYCLLKKTKVVTFNTENENKDSGLGLCVGEARLPECGVIHSHLLGGRETVVATSTASGTTLTGLNPLRFTLLLLAVAVAGFTLLGDELLEHESEEHVLSKETLLFVTALGTCGARFLGRCEVFTWLWFLCLGTLSKETAVTLFPAGFRTGRGSGIVSVSLLDLIWNYSFGG